MTNESSSPNRPSIQSIPNGVRSRYPCLLRRLSKWFGLFLFLSLTLACSAGGLLQRSVNTPQPTRALAPTFTPTADNAAVLPQIIVTPPRSGTPGIIIIPEGMDPSALIPTLPPTAMPLSATPTATLPSPTVEGGAPSEGLPDIPSDEPPVDSTPEAPSDQGQPVAPTPTPVPTDTPIPTATATPIPPTPYVLVESGLVSLRTGPGIAYPLVAQLGPDIPVAITGQNAEGTWYRLCCINRNDATGNDGTVWVVGNHVQVMNDPNEVTLVADVAPPPPPTPTPTFTPTPTITPTPTATFVPFDRNTGPLFFPTCNTFLTIWAKLFVGTPPTEEPAEGYYLKVLFEGLERPPTNQSEPSAKNFYPVGVGTAGYSNLKFNLKYEYRVPQPPSTEQCPPAQIGTGTWQFFVIDGAGNRLSDIVEFTTSPTNPNREVYIAWQRVR
ncbi:MAG: hypothetical protein KDE19_18145 [Caldilineaceae bacterium]|nr:hypothetical protein [Caldilineaceae bacterium]